MKFYFFGGDMSSLERIYDSNFDGTLFLYNAASEEFFTSIAYSASTIKKNFKYMVAIRPYVISPQYLHMICRSINQKIGDVLQINLISGWVKEEESIYDSFLGNVNDKSSSIEKSQYLIKYLDAVNDLKHNLNGSSDTTRMDIYVSATNQFVFDAAVKNKESIIIPYGIYKKSIEPADEFISIKHFDIFDKNIFISISPLIRSTPEELIDLEIGSDVVAGTPEEVVSVLKDLKSSGVSGVLLFSWEDERDRLFNFVKKYKNFV